MIGTVTSRISLLSLLCHSCIEGVPTIYRYMNIRTVSLFIGRANFMTSLAGWRERLRRFLDPDSEAGQGMVEYALILVLIAVVVIVVLILLGNQVVNVFCNIASGLGT